MFGGRGICLSRQSAFSTFSAGKHMRICASTSSGHIAALAVSISLMGFGQPAFAQVIGPNVEELAKELSNPGAANATQNLKLEYRTFDGDQPGSDSRTSTTLTYQPVLPFKLANGNNLIFRPAFSYAWGAPRIEPSTGSLSGENSFGDIPYDLLYSWQREAWTLGAGVVGAIPTSSGISSENWLLGPSLLAVQSTDWGIWGLFPFHNEKVGGNGPDTSITSLQYFGFYGLGNGWLIGTGPTVTYDWNADDGQEWTVPLQLAVSKTMSLGARPIKLNFSVEKNVIRPDAFAEDWTFTFTFSPVTKNPFQRNPPVTDVSMASRDGVTPGR